MRDLFRCCRLCRLIGVLLLATLLHFVTPVYTLRKGVPKHVECCPPLTKVMTFQYTIDHTEPYVISTVRTFSLLVAAAVVSRPIFHWMLHPFFLHSSVVQVHKICSCTWLLLCL